MGILDDSRVLDMSDEEIKRNILGAADQKFSQPDTKRCEAVQK